MACLIRDEVLRELRGETPRTAGHLYLVHLRTLDISRHAFLPNPQCPSCGEIPDDSAELATVVLRPSPKVHPSSYRCRPLSELKTVLERDYLDSQTGLLNAKVVDLATPFANVSVNLPLWQGDEGTAGRSLSFAESELTAILEGLERYCGLTPRGKRTVVCDSYRNLAEFALNPVSVGVHAPVQYERPDFPFQPFQPDQPMRWVWGYSFRQRRPLLVPELLAYYSLGGEGGYVYETSNGCALGGTLEEAIFHGILEIVERDAFLLTWYAQLPAPALNLEKTKDVTLRWMVDHVQADLGYRLHAYDITMEHGIPSVWVMAKNTRQKGPHLICAAGAHVSPVRAVKSAIHELVGMMPMLDAEYDARRAAALRMLEDPFQVRRMEDHSTLYSLPETELRFQFLFSQDGSAKPLAEAFMSQNHGQPHTDLTEDLKGMLQRFFDCGLDVIVVDQTSPEIRRNGLFCVKVLIPGMLPMTFGYHLTRLEGLDRVLRIPMQLGYANAPLSSEQLNPHPHPFP
ncbi:hypothetical protein GCM10025857_06240 [Alicyclobacillus contaminans]|nr:hypothetical protein GCM10025857_06240 [Alicyclobacillus contaminans]